MIIDCDTHLMPADAFDAVGEHLAALKPTLKFDDQALYVDVDFPGYRDVPGTSPLPAPGSGAMFRSLWNIEDRMGDYDRRLGIEQHVVLPQFSGWWSYLIEAELACAHGALTQPGVARLDAGISWTNSRLSPDTASRCRGFDPGDGVGERKRFLFGRARQGISRRRPSVQRTARQPPRALAVLPARRRALHADLSS